MLDIFFANLVYLFSFKVQLFIPHSPLGGHGLEGSLVTNSDMKDDPWEPVMSPQRAGKVCHGQGLGEPLDDETWVPDEPRSSRKNMKLLCDL